MAIRRWLVPIGSAVLAALVVSVVILTFIGRPGVTWPSEVTPPEGANLLVQLYLERNDSPLTQTSFSAPHISCPEYLCRADNDCSISWNTWCGEESIAGPYHTNDHGTAVAWFSLDPAPHRFDISNELVPAVSLLFEDGQAEVYRPAVLAPDHWLIHVDPDASLEQRLEDREALIESLR